MPENLDTGWEVIPMGENIQAVGMTDSRRFEGWKFSARLPMSGNGENIECREHFPHGQDRGCDYSIPSLSPAGRAILGILATRKDTREKAEEILAMVEKTLGQ